MFLLAQILLYTQGTVVSTTLGFAKSWQKLLQNIKYINILISSQNVVLANKNMGFDLWKQPPYPIYFQAWVWNVTNSENVINGEKPYLVQRGPYTYR